MIKNIYRLINSSDKLKIILPVITKGVGYAKSAQRIQAELGSNKVDLIDLSKKSSYKQVLICFFSKHVIINGYSGLGCYQVLLILLFKKNINIYVHEGASQISKIENKWHFLKKKYIRYKIKKIKVFCVSYNQRRQLLSQSILSKKSEVIYNCAGIKPSTLIDVKSKRVKVLMAGTLQDRKGSKLFSEVADFFASNDSSFDFYWAGRRGRELIDLSNNITFLGYIEDMSDLLKNIDIFLLSSRDEPFGLSALEALQEGKKMVCHKDSGVAEAFNTVSGVEIFEAYSSASAIDALINANESMLDQKKIEEIIAELFSVESFIDNIKNKIGYIDD